MNQIITAERSQCPIGLSCTDCAEWLRLGQAVADAQTEEEFDRAVHAFSVFELSHNLDSLVYPHLF